jgi:predicted phosphodiesterase
MSKSILVIPDPHDEPDVSKDRFEWAGKLIVDRRPDAIVCLGDGPSMDSLSLYDVGTVLSEGRRYKHDIDSFMEAMDRFDAPIDAYQRKLIINKKKRYTPRKVYCMGNHENRINIAIKKDPKLIGYMSTDDLKLVERGWEVFPLTEPAEIFGVNFAHYFTSGVLGKPIFGINHAKALVSKTYSNVVVGHTHTRSFWEDTSIHGEKLMGIVAGCYYEHDLKFSTENDRKWTGLIWLTVEDSEINPEFIGIQQIKEEYA